ncbi:MAG: hypothetical protein M1824_000329 [Vezdaea acicularis]|nr:MAG: hypothetical protein M1824_000329 [Vezdaea acicularis]
MASLASKAAGQVGKAAKDVGGKTVLQKGAQRDPELYVRIRAFRPTIGLTAAATYPFTLTRILPTDPIRSRKPTSSTSEAAVSVAHGSMPWQTEGDKGGDEHFKYQYHPGGNPKNAPKNAPSALHSVIVPNVNLPKELHEKYNKWGKDGY